MILLEITQSIIFIVLAYAAVVLTQHWLKARRVQKRQLDLPVLNLEDGKFAEAQEAYFANLPGLLETGYAKYKRGFYQLFSPTGFLAIASANYVQEMSRLPEGTLDFHSASQQRMVGEYTWLQIADELLAQTIRNDLTRQLGHLLPRIRREVQYCVENEVPRCQEWTPVSLQKLAPRLIAIVVGRIIVGPELNRDEEWVASVTQFVSDVYEGGVKLKGYSPFVRPFAARFLIPENRRVWRHQAAARRRLVPLLLQQRSTAVKSGHNSTNTSNEQHLCLLQLLLEKNAKQHQPRTLEQLAELASVAYVGSTNTVATTLVNLILDIAARPDDALLLREEVAVLEAEADKTRPKEYFSVKHTSKLDSYMKESQRLNPAHLMTFSRIVRRPFTLSNGMSFPARTHLMIPASMISRDSELYHHPETFDGFRFSDARTQRPEDAHRYQFTMTTPQSMHFGYGRNACPGRFFASAVIKSFAVTILTEFDLRIAESRPHSRALGARNSPPQGTEIWFRKRKIPLRPEQDLHCSF